MKNFNDNISYEILENGYNIYLDGNIWISQVDEYSKPVDDTKSFEENCIAQLEQLTTVVEEIPDSEVIAQIKEVLNA